MLAKQHIQVVKRGNLQDLETGNCRDCQASCQSACKTSCTVSNQPCRQQEQG